MTFLKALEVANEKSHLVNVLKSHEAVLSEIIIAPSDKIEFEQFKKLYIETLDAQEAVVPFMQSDLIVLGVFDKHRILKEGILLISEI